MQQRKKHFPRLIKADVTQNDVLQNDVTQNDVTQNYVTQNNVIQNDENMCREHCLHEHCHILVEFLQYDVMAFNISVGKLEDFFENK